MLPQQRRRCWRAPRNRPEVDHQALALLREQKTHRHRVGWVIHRREVTSADRLAVAHHQGDGASFAIRRVQNVQPHDAEQLPVDEAGRSARDEYMKRAGSCRCHGVEKGQHLLVHAEEHVELAAGGPRDAQEVPRLAADQLDGPPVVKALVRETRELHRFVSRKHDGTGVGIRSAAQRIVRRGRSHEIAVLSHSLNETISSAHLNRVDQPGAPAGSHRRETWEK